MRKIGIFGGSFDPIHFGHLRPAREITDALGLDLLLFVPSGLPPHRDAPVARPEQRLAMLQAAIAGEPRFQLDQRELKRQGPSYTVDTLTALRAEHPQDALVLVVGADAFLGFPQWRRWHELFGLAHVAVAHRPGWQLVPGGELGKELEGRQADAHTALSRPAGSVLLQAVTPQDISSTKVRETAAAHRDLAALVPAPVAQLITDSHCYG